MVSNRMKELHRVMHEEVIALLIEGRLTLEDIAREVGCTTSTVFHIQKKNGLLRREMKKAVVAQVKCVPLANAVGGENE